ncbi:zinc finger protein 782-like [Ixodes scapularis]
MELNQSSSHGDGATLLRETSCPLKVTEDIWFACCSCTYVTRDQHGIVSHLAAHGDEQSKCQHPPLSGSGSKSQVLGNTQKNKSEKPFKPLRGDSLRTAVAAPCMRRIRVRVDVYVYGSTRRTPPAAEVCHNPAVPHYLDC